ncbi:MAG TPA: hypothetical protein PLZ55_16070, partial [bacterium]|nr:hypothetical protein [bacterium]
LRAADLQRKILTTVCGTGVKVFDFKGGGLGTKQPLNSPWDVAVAGDVLYVAIAGSHQIWTYDPKTQIAEAFAGTGQENIIDAHRTRAALAQPSGLCVRDHCLYFADSEVSAIRELDLERGTIRTLVGKGLFEFGDVDGDRNTARLQHPLGVAAWKDTLLVADTYNHKIKQVDPQDGGAKTLFGTGRSGLGFPGKESAFYEPGGLTVLGNLLFVADTNNHRIVRVDLSNREWSVFQLKWTKKVENNSTSRELLSEIVIAPGLVEMEVDIVLPPDAELTPDYPIHLHVEGGPILVENAARDLRFDSPALPLRCEIQVTDATTTGTLLVDLDFGYCLKKNGVCIPSQMGWILPIRLHPDGKTHIPLTASFIDSGSQQ